MQLSDRGTPKAGVTPDCCICVKHGKFSLRTPHTPHRALFVRKTPLAVDDTSIPASQKKHDNYSLERAPRASQFIFYTPFAPNSPARLTPPPPQHPNPVTARLRVLPYSASPLCSRSAPAPSRRRRRRTMCNILYF